MNDTIKLVLLGLGFLICCEVCYMMYHFYRKKKELTWILQDDQDAATHEFSKDELAFIKKEASKLGAFAIDDITWHDLDMDRIYQHMDGCLCTAGDIELYHMLRTPCLTEETIKQRRNIMRFFNSNTTWKQQIKTQCFRIGGQCERSTDELYELDQNKIQVHSAYMLPLLLLTIVSFVVACILPYTLMIPMMLVCMDGMVCYKERNSRSYAFLSTLYLYRYARAFTAISEMTLDPILRKAYDMDRLAASLSHLHTSWFPDFYEGDGLFLMLGKNIFFLELFSFGRLYKQLYEKKEDLKQAIRVIGELEALLVVDTMVHQSKVYCDASVDTNMKFNVQGMVHPLLADPVSNDLQIEKNVLISGSNASGKSTFLKTIAVNAIMAQTFGVAFAKTYAAPRYRIYTSMSLQDSIELKESYFMAEVRSIKRIVDACDEAVPILCLIDEILRGTNTGERIASSSAILMRLAHPQMLCIAATHDLELTTILAKYYHNMHFSEELDEQGMSFSYRIQEGPSNSHNATALLESLGFEASLLNEAKQLRSMYEQTNRWTWNEVTV